VATEHQSSSNMPTTSHLVFRTYWLLVHYHVQYKFSMLFTTASLQQSLVNVHFLTLELLHRLIAKYSLWLIYSAAKLSSTGWAMLL